jgi:hypothetical protein
MKMVPIPPEGREATGVGLAEAKSIVEQIEKSIPTKARSAAGKLAAHASLEARARLAPGEAVRGGGPGKWLALIAVGLIVVLVALYY